MTKSWQDKYHGAAETYTRVNDKRFADLDPHTTVLIPSPADIEAEVAALGTDEMITFTELRHRLAARHGADGTCPVMCGMNLRIVAEVAWDELDRGAAIEELNPVWNVIDPSSNLAKKLAGGPKRVTELRATATPIGAASYEEPTRAIA